MLTKKVKVRITFLVLLLSLTVATIFFIFNSLKENIVYFFSPTEISQELNISYKDTIRIGGLVKENSLRKEGKIINFIITDLKNEIIVNYEGLVPNLFSEGKGVIAEGKLKDKKYFIANKILAKHDENYMPPEVSKALEE